jgi:hypothetical protein
LGGFLAKNKKTTLAALVDVSIQAQSGACKVTRTQKEVRSEKIVVVICGKNLVRLVTKG